MIKRILIATIASLPLAAYAADPLVPLEPADVDVGNQASLQRGASLFVNYCMGCHSVQYMRWDRMGEGIGLTVDQVREYLQVTGERPGDPMTIAMPRGESARWFGTAPPDLTLAARSRGADWLYNYMLTFYLDESRPLGVNNLVFPDVGMPHALWELQGWQRAVFEEYEDERGNLQTRFMGFEQVTEGSMSPAEYRRVARDLANFLAYVATPEKLERQALGFKVILFLLLFLVFAWLLKREYWKDVH